MSIGKKLALWLVSILLFITAGTIAAFYFFELNEEAKKLELFGGMTGRVIEESLVSSMRTRNLAMLNERLQDIKRNTENISDIWLVDRDGRVGAGTEPASIGTKLTVDASSPGEPQKAARRGTFLGDDNTYRWRQPVKNRPECHRCHGSRAEYNGTVIIDFALTDVIQHVRREIYGGAAIMLVAASSIGIFMLALSNRLIGRRVQSVVDTVRLLKENAYEVKDIRQARDEFAGLEEEFNVMAEVIQTRDREKENLVKQLSAKNQELLDEIGLRKRWETMLREQKMFSERLIQSSAMATFVLDPDHKIVLWNKACEELTGLAASDMVGTGSQWRAFYPSRRQTLADIVIEGNVADLPGLYEQHSRSALAANGLHAEGWYENLNGRDRYILFDAAPIYDSQGDMIAVIETLQDVTERKRGEETLREMHQTLEAVIKASPLAIESLDPDGAVVMWNPAAERIFGWSAEEVIGRFHPIVQEDKRSEFLQLSERILRGESHTGVEIRRRKKDGTPIDLSLSTAPLRDAHGRITGMLGVLADITERKRTENALRESETRFRELADLLPQPVYESDLQGVLTFANRSAFEHFGYPIGTLPGKVGVADMIAEEDRPRARRNMESLMRGGAAGNNEYTALRKDGTTFPVVVYSVSIVRDGSPIGMRGVIMDISERKSAEQELQRNYDTQTAINWILNISLKNIPLEAVLKQALDIILSIPWLSLESRGSVFLVEGDPARLVMKAHRGLSDSAQEKCAVVPFGKCLCGRAAAKGEVQFSDSLDERHEVLYEGIVPHGHYCVPIKQADRVVGVINMYIKEGHRRDDREIQFLTAFASALAGIIQRKRMEQEQERLHCELRDTFVKVERSQKEWQVTFDSIRDMIALVDGDLRVMKANRAFSGYIGLTPQQAIGRKINELLPLTDSSESNSLYGEDPVTDRKVTCEVLDPRTNKVFLTSSFLFTSPEGKHLGRIYIAKDVTDEKEKERRFMLNERLAALGQMASGIAHEINNPLASIAGCSEGLLARARKGQWDLKLFESYLGIIQEEVFRCKNITTAMLSFVRKTTYEKKDIVLTDMIDKTIEIIGFQGRLKNVDVVRRYQGTQHIIHGNEGELRQVLLAVITNALDAMDDKGTLTVETGAQDGDFDVRIADTGPGISRDIISRIYDPFFTTKSEKGGTGLGLSIARKIVMNHNGNIDVLSDPGQGTTIIITLPL